MSSLWSEKNQPGAEPGRTLPAACTPPRPTPVFLTSAKDGVSQYLKGGGGEVLLISRLLDLPPLFL